MKENNNNNNNNNIENCHHDQRIGGFIEGILLRVSSTTTTTTTTTCEQVWFRPDESCDISSLVNSKDFLMLSHVDDSMCAFVDLYAKNKKKPANAFATTLLFSSCLGFKPDNDLPDDTIYGDVLLARK